MQEIRSPSTKTSPRRWALYVLLGVLAQAGAAVAVAWYMGALSAAPRPMLIVVSGDTAGWIIPCGCTSNQSGGLLRRGTHVKALRQDAEVIVADAGGAPGGNSAYHQVKFEAILRGELAMGLAVHNLGGPEAALGADYLRRIGRELEVPFVSANLRDDQGALVAEPIRVIETAGRRVGFIGVLSRRYVREGLQVDDPREAVLRTIAASRGRHDLLIVLAYLPVEELEQLAASLPEVDALVGGPTGQSIEPRRVGPTRLAAATNKGKFLVQLGPIAANTSDWTGAVVEMDGLIDDDPQQQANVQRYLGELARRDFPAQVSGFAPTLATQWPRDFRFTGNQSCVACHQQACKQWDSSRHAHGWETLKQRGYQVDSYCQQCHTTGYGMPGGFESISLSPTLVSIGCESCHGPAQTHVRNPKVRTPFTARDQCGKCHDRENSPTFAYEDYWQRIVHGAKVTAPGGD